MNIKELKEQIKETVVEAMLEFWEKDIGYSKADVKKCGKLLEEYLKALEKLKAPDDRAIMNEVKNVVLALNDLNESTDCCLIETMEREAICEIIQEAAVACGLKNVPDDVTEEWRDW